MSEIPFGRLMLRIAGPYARTVQRQLHTTGHLFEKRYYPVLVDADEYLLELLRYIHLNPVRARMVDGVGDHPRSSHHAYLGTPSSNNSVSIGSGWVGYGAKGFGVPISAKELDIFEHVASYGID